MRRQYGGAHRDHTASAKDVCRMGDQAAENFSFLEAEQIHNASVLTPQRKDQVAHQGALAARRQDLMPPMRMRSVAPVQVSRRPLDTDAISGADLPRQSGEFLAARFLLRRYRCRVLRMEPAVTPFQRQVADDAQAASDRPDSQLFGNLPVCAQRFGE